MRRGGTVSGAVSLVMIFVVLCLTVFSVLTLSTAVGESKLARPHSTQPITMQLMRKRLRLPRSSDREAERRRSMGLRLHIRPMRMVSGKFFRPGGRKSGPFGHPLASKSKL